MTENIILHDKVKNIIKVDLTNFSDDYEYNKIINCIKNNYDKKNDIYLLIETKKLKLENISLSKLYKFSVFLKEYKKRNIQYLKRTIINIYNKATYDILYNLFTYLSEPIAIIVVNLYNKENLIFVKTFYPSI